VSTFFSKTPQIPYFMVTCLAYLKLLDDNWWTCRCGKHEGHNSAWLTHTPKEDRKEANSLNFNKYLLWRAVTLVIQNRFLEIVPQHCPGRHTNMCHALPLSLSIHVRGCIKKFRDWAYRLECIYLIKVWAASLSK